jgi:AraC family transcriptional activator of pobA
MIRIITREDVCIISHHSYLYTFRKEFLSEKLWKGLRQLPAFRNSSSTFLLNNKQEQQLTGIFEKINNEQKSDYIFSEDLQRTYLVELIHFINKLPAVTPH